MKKIIRNQSKIRQSIVLLISMYFLPEPGGGSLAAYHRATMLKKVGYCVFVLTGFPTYPTGKITDPKYKGKVFFVEKYEDLTIIRLRLLPFKHSGYIKRLLMYMNFVLLSILFYFRITKYMGKIDIVYARSPIIFSCFNGFFYGKISRSVFIYEVPDLWPEELIMIGSAFFKLIFPVGKLLAKISYRLPDIIITVSDLAKSIIQSNYNPTAPVYSIPTGVDPKRYPKLTKHESREKLVESNIIGKELQSKFIILYAGILSNAQKVENLFPVAKSVEEDKEIAFVIVGEGDQRPFIENELPKYKNVYLLPYQPRNVMPLIVYAADICTVLLSNEPIFDIAFPTKFYESLACNKPILAICRGELAEVIKSNRIGLAAEPYQIKEMADFIYKLKNSTQYCSLVKKNVSITLENYTLDNIAITFRSILDKENKKHNMHC
jgi:glycosyltransferase involved in cell wall biosynthesis